MDTGSFAVYLQCTRRDTAGALHEVPTRGAAHCGRTLCTERAVVRNERFVTVLSHFCVQHATRHRHTRPGRVELSIRRVYLLLEVRFL